MERLTKRTRRPDINIVYTLGTYGDTVAAAMDIEDIDMVLKRLCEYEDTGLKPKEIIEMKKSADIKRCRRIRIVGVPKKTDRNMIDYGCSRETVAKALKTLKKFKH